jgi:hypothetical protein
MSCFAPMLKMDSFDLIRSSQAMYPARSIPMLDLGSAPWDEIISRQGDIDDKIMTDYIRGGC